MSQTMGQAERRQYLIDKLIKENPRYGAIELPPEEDPEGQKQLLRSLMNVREPMAVDHDFLTVQDDYLREAIGEKGITDWEQLSPVKDGIYLWRGDITTLRCDAIVNAANSQMLGCFVPCHRCIDNCIHTYAGIQLRLECDRQMRLQGRAERTGSARITPGYNLPARYVIHTVGPIIYGPLTRKDEELLASCYRSCLNLAMEYDLRSVAFCCISTGEFHFPPTRAAEIAVETVSRFQAEHPNRLKVIFNVFKETDEEIYEAVLSKK